MTGSMTATLSRVVTAADTAAAWGKDFPAVASTPFVLGLAEVACHAAIAGDLEDGYLSVGTGASLEHVAPSLVGAELVATAVLLERTGSRLTFSVTVTDGDRTVATVQHRRAVVSRAKIEAAMTRLGADER